jgi:hypothetical protein
MARAPIPVNIQHANSFGGSEAISGPKKSHVKRGFEF